jgi:hypothetical protein
MRKQNILILTGEHYKHSDYDPPAPWEQELGQEGRGEGRHEPQLHYGRLPHLLATFLHLDATRSSHGENCHFFFLSLN